MRKLFRHILAILMRAVLWKHRPQVVAIWGDGANAVARELIYTVLNIEYPAVQNSEKPEVEFSIPLTVFGAKGYPQNVWQWVKSILKTVLQLLRLPRFSHVLILEVDAIDSAVTEFWMHHLSPHHTVNTSQLDTSLEIYQQLAIDIGKKFGIEEEISQTILAEYQPRGSQIRFYFTDDNGLIVDATYHFYPKSLSSVAEILPIETQNVYVLADKIKMEWIQQYPNWQFFSGWNKELAQEIRHLGVNATIILAGFAPITKHKFPIRQYE